MGHTLALPDLEHPVIFIKTGPVKSCPDFVLHLKKFADATNDEAGGVRVSSKAKGKRHADAGSLAIDATDLKDEAVEVLPSKAKGKRRAHSISASEPSDGSSISDSESSIVVVPYKRPRHRRLELSPSESTDDSSLASTFSNSLIDELDPGNLLSRGESFNNAIEVENIRHWPVDFYVSEVAEGFQRCSNAAATHRGVATAFERFFGVPFVSSTFYDNRRVWEYLPNYVLRQRLTRLGQHEDATWVAFMARAARPPRK